MPELPEVETVAGDLARSVVGRCLTRLEVRRADIVRGAARGDLPRLAGRTITAVGRRGKVVLLHFSGARLAVHLGMSGQLTVTERDAPLGSHTHLVFHLDDGRQVRHRDPRRFGFAELAWGEQPLRCLAGLGPEPFEVGQRSFRALLRASRRAVKPLLMDQQVIAGIGNIYADEILFRAGVHPLARSAAVGAARARRLWHAMQETLREAIAHQGTTVSDYVTGSGVPGEFQRFLRVYGREDQPCLRCGARVRRIVVAARSAHYCPRCQARR